MARKKYLIAMDNDVHLDLKTTASKCGVYLGDLIGLLMKGLENKIKRAYKTAGIKDRTTLIDQDIIFVLFDADKYGWPEEKLTEVLKDLGRDQKNSEWTDKTDD